jgi:hypothetical protein
MQPMIEDAIKVTGRLVMQLLREDGSEEVFEFENLVPDGGKAIIAERMLAAPAAAAMSHMAVGTSGTAPAAPDTTLGAEIGRVALSGTVRALAVLTYTAAFGPGVGTGALVEAGIFNAAAAGGMLARTTFALINKAAGDTLNVTWTVTVG